VIACPNACDGGRFAAGSVNSSSYERIGGSKGMSFVTLVGVLLSSNTNELTTTTSTAVVVISGKAPRRQCISRRQVRKIYVIRGLTPGLPYSAGRVFLRSGAAQQTFYSASMHAIPIGYNGRRLLLVMSGLS
jgi:hypothetical protein